MPGSYILYGRCEAADSLVNTKWKPLKLTDRDLTGDAGFSDIELPLESVPSGQVSATVDAYKGCVLLVRGSPELSSEKCHQKKAK